MVREHRLHRLSDLSSDRFPGRAGLPRFPGESVKVGQFQAQAYANGTRQLDVLALYRELPQFLRDQGR
jgi:hypothetical protein